MLILLGVFFIGVVGNAHPITNLNKVQFNSAPQVQTAQGTVVGTEAADGGYFEFYGIPYADTTTGSHRFKAPLPPPSFTDVFTANRKDVKCLRPLGNGFEGTEDCLVADILTPSLDESKRLPVMVWVKGSEFSNFNEDNLSFENFVKKDVVVVSLNFRQSIFGFLCLGTETAPGNAGLKDIIAGLRWVKQNIGNFGGNPDDITLIGHGSGSAIVDLVTLSPMAEGLIQKAISQSGNALAPWAVSRDNLASAINIAEALGHNAFDNIEELSDIFTRVSASALMAAINDFELTDNSLVFAPCVERSVPAVEPFMLNTPYEIISEGKFLQIPFITGFVDNEGTIRAEEIKDSNWLTQMEESFSDFLQPDLKFENEDKRDQVAAQIRTSYFEDNLISQDVQKTINYVGDTMVVVSAIREARLRSETSTRPLYLYQFSYKGTLGKPFVGPIEVDRAAHSEELAYLLNKTPLVTETNEASARDLTVADVLIERWSNFAKSGNPTSETSQVLWQRFTVENPHYLKIVNGEEVGELADSTIDSDLTNPHPEVVAFWNEIYEENFLDAQSNWDLSIRDDDNNDVESTPAPMTPAVTTPAPDVTTSSPDATTSSPDATTSSPDATTAKPAPDSASTAVGYTFMIISAFALLDKFHSMQILL